MAKVLVTGGTGFIGSHLVEKLLAQGREVKVLALRNPLEEIENENLELIKKAGAEIVYGDLLDNESLVNAISGVDTIFHLAAISRPMKVNNIIYYNTNVEGTKNLLEVARDRPIKKFIHVSTVSVLGLSCDGNPLKEDDFQYDDLQYGLTKREGENLALLYHYKFGVPVVVIRPSLVYGPRCMVRLVMFRFVKNGIFPLFNGGRAKMEFAYVDNIVDSLLLAEKTGGILGETFNITDGQSYEIRDVLNTMADELGVRRPFLNFPVWLGVSMGYLVEFLAKLANIFPPFSHSAAHWMSEDVNVYDCSKAKKMLGYNPKITLNEGIKKSVTYYKKKGLL